MFFLQRSQTIDELTYEYDGNQLQKVTDAPNANRHFGFVDGTNPNDDYEYDLFGNMIADRNKGITQIRYNHLNLPIQILFANGSSIMYHYTANGVKFRKFVQNTATNTFFEVNYIGGFQYQNTKLNFIHIPQGYVNVLKPLATPAERVYDYIYQYKDHLGNVRLSYSFDRDRQEIRTLTEHNYYPFGLEHSYLQTRRRPELVDEIVGEININSEPSGRSRMVQVDDVRYQYKYNGKEFQDELGLNMYDYGWRNYAPDIARWVNSDPLLNDLKFTFDPKLDEKDNEVDMLEAFSTMVEVGGGIYNPHNLNPYSYGYNNPVSFDDPDGRCPWCIAALKGAVQEYATQVVGNLIEGKSLGDALTQVDGKAIVKAAVVDGLTLGMGSLVSKGTKAVSIAKKVDKANDTKKAVEKVKNVEKAVGTKATGKLDKSPTGPGKVPKSDRDPKRVPSAKEKKEQLDQQDGKCANCDTKTTEADSRSHHYPTRHADGGTETVQVCKDCHKDLHKKD